MRTLHQNNFLDVCNINDSIPRNIIGTSTEYEGLIECVDRVC